MPVRPTVSVRQRLHVPSFHLLAAVVILLQLAFWVWLGMPVGFRGFYALRPDSTRTPAILCRVPATAVVKIAGVEPPIVVTTEITVTRPCPTMSPKR